MKHLLIALLLSPGLLFSQTIVKKTFESFSKIETFGNMEVTLVQGEKLEVEADMRQFSHDDITIKLNDDELVVRLGSKLLDEDAAIKVSIHCQSISKLSASGGSDVDITGTLETEELFLVANSGGTVHGDIKATKLSSRVSSGSTISLSGTCKEHESIASAGGVLDCFDLATENADIKTNTGGKAKVNVTGTLKANASTKGYIGYKPQPAHLIEDTSLGGEIMKVE